MEHRGCEIWHFLLVQAQCKATREQFVSASSEKVEPSRPLADPRVGRKFLRVRLSELRVDHTIRSRTMHSNHPFLPIRSPRFLSKKAKGPKARTTSSKKCNDLSQTSRKPIVSTNKFFVQTITRLSQTPGNVKSGKSGQFPSLAGSPPILTHCECDGVGPSSTNNWCHPGGHTYAFGGAVIVHAVPAHENAGKMMRPPLMTLPCVLDEAAVVCSGSTFGFDPNPTLTCDEGDAHRARGPLEQRHLNRVLPAQRPVCLRNRKRRLFESLV